MLGMHSKMPVGLHVKYLLLLSHFSWNWNVLTNFSRTSQYQISWNPLSNSWVSHGQRDTLKLVSAILEYFIVNIPKRTILELYGRYLVLHRSHGVCSYDTGTTEVSTALKSLSQLFYEFPYSFYMILQSPLPIKIVFCCDMMTDGDNHC
jgi:hypothetical protein